MARKDPEAFVNQVVKTQDEYGNERLTTFGIGTVLCWCDRAPWCEHVEVMVREGQDLLDGVLADFETGTISVPFIPSHGIWVPVRFSQIDGRYAWMLWIADSILDMEDGFLGVIGPGEGRAVVRGMIHTWSLKYRLPDLKCTMSSHGYKSEMAIRAHSGDKAWAAAHEWTLRWEHKCLPCHLHGSTFGESFDDLVPDLGPASRRSWAGNKINMEKW
jgi:hypothetical protein